MRKTAIGALVILLVLGMYGAYSYYSVSEQTVRVNRIQRDIAQRVGFPVDIRSEYYDEDYIFVLTSPKSSREQLKLDVYERKANDRVSYYGGDAEYSGELLRSYHSVHLSAPPAVMRVYYGMNPELVISTVEIEHWEGNQETLELGNGEFYFIVRRFDQEDENMTDRVVLYDKDGNVI